MLSDSFIKGRLARPLVLIAGLSAFASLALAGRSPRSLAAALLNKLAP